MKKALLIFFLISSVCISHAQFICNNIPPVAIAGNDTTIQNNQASCTPVPVTITLNGNRSYDQDGIIVSYLWTGPYGVTNPNAAITTVMGLTPGNHSFILKVTDNNGAFAYDTFHISIVPANRPLIPARLIPIGTLSQGRAAVTISAAGNKLVFTGDSGPGVCATASVDIFDISTRIWTTAQLSQARIGMGVAVQGNKIFFAGGYVPLTGPPAPPSTCYITNWQNTRSSAVDIYDASTNKWSISQLSSARYPIG